MKRRPDIRLYPAARWQGRTFQQEAGAEQAGETFYARERVFGVFSRSFLLPDGTDGAQVKAELKDGVLTIVVPKKPEAQPKKIALGKADAGS